MAGRKKSVFKGYWGDDSCCLGGDEHVDGQGGGLVTTRSSRRRSRSPGKSPRWTRTWSGVEFGVKSDAGCDNSVDKGCWGIVG